MGFVFPLTKAGDEKCKFFQPYTGEVDSIIKRYAGEWVSQDISVGDNFDPFEFSKPEVYAEVIIELVIVIQG